MANQTPLIAASPWYVLNKTAITAVEAALATTVVSLPDNAISVEGQRGFRLTALCNGADDETATVTLYGVDAFDNSNSPNGYRCQSIGSIALTFGTTVYTAGTVAPHQLVPLGKTYRYIDTAVFTATTFGTYRVTNLGAPAGAAFSPADNTIAEFNISDVSGHHFIVPRVTTYGLTATSKIYFLIQMIHHLGD